MENENMSIVKFRGLLGKTPQTINHEVKRGTTLQSAQGLSKASILLTIHKQFKTKKKSVGIRQDLLNIMVI